MSGSGTNISACTICHLANHALRAAGFVDVTRVSCGAGKSPPGFVLDDPKYEWESLYVEAAKPVYSRAHV